MTLETAGATEHAEARNPSSSQKERRTVASRTKVQRAKPEEIQATADAAVLPANVTDVVMVTDVEAGGKLENGDWSGLGGRTLFGPAFMIEGRHHPAPVAMYESQADARALFALLAGEEGELWQRKQRRLEAIAAAEAAEAAAAAEAKESARAVRRSNEGGGGSSRPSSSRGKRSASTGTPSDAALKRSQRVSKRTLSQRLSSSPSRRESSRGSTGRPTDPLSIVLGSLASS